MSLAVKMQRNRPVYTHKLLKRGSLRQEWTDFCEMMKPPTPSIAPRDYARFYPAPGYFLPLSFTVPPSSLPPRTKRDTKALLDLLLPLETAYLPGGNTSFLQQLSKLKKLDSEVGEDFETSIWEARKVGMDLAYLGWVRRGLDRRNNWQGAGVFSVLAYKSELIIQLLNSILQAAELVESDQIYRRNLEARVASCSREIDQLDSKTSEDVTLIWTGDLSIEGKREATVELINVWKSAVQKNLLSNSAPPSSPSSSTKTSPLLAYLPFLAFNKPLIAKRYNSQRAFKPPLDLVSVVGIVGGSSVAAGTIKRSEYSSGDDSASLESFDQEDSVFEFRYEPTGPVDESFRG